MSKQYIVYADGACSNNQDSKTRVGAYAGAIFTPINGTTYKKDVCDKVNGATNNQMELMAVIESLKAIISIDPSDTPEVKIYSDSQYVIKGITSWLPNWRVNCWKTSGKKEVKNKEMWFALDDLLSKFSKYAFEKVEAHSNDEWNNYCNDIAQRLCGSKIR